MYGTQAIEIFGAESAGFENDVKMYGTQARKSVHYSSSSLRMM